MNTSRLLIGVFLILVTATSVGSADDKKKASSSVRLSSVYQAQPLDFNMKGAKIRRVTVSGVLKDGVLVDLSLDPNTCTVNQFGDPSICTLIAPIRITAKLSQLRIADRAKPPRRLFRVESKRFGKELVLYLVAPRGASGFRLVLDRPAKKMRVVVPLEKRQSVKAPKT